jgi:AcrR family transcriptional regulator
MADPAGSGIRERKKVRTREALVEAATELCLRQGFDNTTVEQIATAADVSTRTFSRYFPNKGAVIAAIADEMDVHIATALSRQPADLTEYEALLEAHLAVFAPDTGRLTPGFQRMAALIAIVNGSDSAKASAFAQQRGISQNAALTVMGNRMGVAFDHPAVRLISDMWTMLFATSFSGLGLPGNDPIEPKVVCDRLCATFELFRRSWSPWNGSEHAVAHEVENGPEHGQPPASAPG